MAYHARPCQFVTLSPLLLCIIHGYPPRPCVVVPHRPFSPSLPRRFYRFCFPRCTSFLLPSSPLFYVSQYFPFNLSSFSSIFRGPSRSCRLTRRAMFLPRSLVYLSLRLFPREDAMAWRRVGKAHRHHAISFIAAGPPRIQVSGGARDGDGEKKAIANGSRW